MPTQRPLLRARLTWYRPVARMGATMRKPENAPASHQNWSRAAHSNSQPKAASSRPWIRPGAGLRRRSAQPSASQRRGERRVTGADEVVAGGDSLSFMLMSRRRRAGQTACCSRSAPV